MKNDQLLLKEIIECCNDIKESIEFFGNDEEDFLENKIYQKSCAFSVVQIGEAVKFLSFGLINDNRDIPWKDIAGFRNIIVHNYGAVNKRYLWKTITNLVPVLREACERILAEVSSE